MSIYLLRHGDLIKIGYSSNLGGRVRSIMTSVPGEVLFLGHMPGDRELEAYLHKRFEETRFSGEWFYATADLEAFARVVLDPELPSPDSYPVNAHRRRQDRDDAWASYSTQMRDHAARCWPTLNHKERIAAVADALGWTARRARSLYNVDPGLTLRQVEADDLAYWIAQGSGGTSAGDHDTPKRGEAA